jgi:phage terminase large subunit
MEKTKNVIKLPFNFQPRDYQRPILGDIDDGWKRIVVVAHRRFGKDKVCMNIMAREMFRRIGGYFYVLPTYAQGKKVIWNGMDRDGFKFTDHIPQALRTRTDNSEMIIQTRKPRNLMSPDEISRSETGEKIPGSLFQVVGSDNIDSIVGANPVGIIFSEWALQDPSAWDYLRPILAENGGFAIFIYTVRGKNHGWTTAQIAQKYPDVWRYYNLTVEDTKAIPADILAQERLEIIEKDGNDDLYMQEYMNDFGIAIKGSYYGDLFKKIDENNQIGGVPYDPNHLVHTAWDMGLDNMKVWFIQQVGREFHAIDYMEGVEGGLRGFLAEMTKKNYTYGKHLVPHDAAARSGEDGRTRVQIASDLGFKFEVIPTNTFGVDNGIEAVKGILPRFWFDEERTKNGVSSLRSYQHEWDEKLKIFKPNPLHDWASHGADALRTFAVGWKDEAQGQVLTQQDHQDNEYQVEVETDPYES